MESQDMFSETVLEDLANQFYDKTRASVQKLCYGCKVGELIFIIHFKLYGLYLYQSPNPILSLSKR